MPKYGIDWTKVDEANEPRLAALKPAPKVTAVTEEGANAPAVTKAPRAKRTPRKPAEEA
jgi:hypothetical protein